MNNFTVGFLLGVFGVFCWLAVVPLELKLITLKPSSILATKFLDEPFKINRYDPCPDVIDFKIRP